MPGEQREAIEHKEEVFGFLKQSHISEKNMRRLRELAASNDSRVAELASLVIEVAKVKRHKRGRLKVLARERGDLIRALEETGLIHAHYS